MPDRIQGGDLFDRHSRSYIDTVNAGLRASGEDVGFFARLKAADHVARELADEIPGEVLDFGCGIGLGTSALARALPKSHVIGCDPSGESLREARRRVAPPLQVRFVLFAGDRLPFRSSAFDVVFTSCVFHHINPMHHAAWTSEIVRVLRPGGSFFIFEHNPFNPLTRRSVAKCAFDEGAILLPPWYTCSTLRAAGLSVMPPRFYFFFPHFLAPLRPLERLLNWCPIGAQYYVRGRRS